MISDQRTAAVVSAGTTATGISSILEWIPNDIGKLAVLVGIVLSLVLIFVHLINGYSEHKRLGLEREKTKLEKEKMKLEIEKLKIKN